MGSCGFRWRYNYYIYWEICSYNRNGVCKMYFDFPRVRVGLIQPETEMRIDVSERLSDLLVCDGVETETDTENPVTRLHRHCCFPTAVVALLPETQCVNDKKLTLCNKKEFKTNILFRCSLYLSYLLHINTSVKLTIE